MGDVKDKVKGFMKRFNNTLSSSSSSSFKGQGRVLGSPSSGSTSSIPTRPLQNPNSKPKLVNPPSDSSADSKPPVANSIATDQNRSDLSNKSNPARNPADGFDPFDSFITSGKRSGNGYSLNVFECPICGQSYRSEEEVSVHVDSCVNDGKAKGSEYLPTSDAESRSELEGCVGTFLSGKPSQGSLDIVLKLLSNIVREPENSKFRKIRLSNPKIKEAIGEAVGGVELLEFVGFKLQEEGGEMWATMDVPTEEKINILSKVIDSIDRPKLDEQQKKASTESELIEPKKVDRQIRVFFAVPENIAAHIELPDFFYKLSVEEVKREAIMRKQKIAESQLLVPKSYKEKQAKAARRKYTRTVIRIQFPDGVVLQGVFSPWEPTSALYEFVSTALKEPGLEFELIHPVGVKRRTITHFPAEGERSKTLDDEELVPSALVKFRPIETDSVVFTGLRNELLEIIEPLINGSAVAPPAQV
ncbi:plant UBX domain-containing protein 2 [Benincasa hispida]|uniref:plant UBX domain-containing protein 2 n=1 Tax=Benincasa hispida TaxID=102211 RepID=UPI0018FF48B7|nr:plant UBX domain-containing protein 2 [Benincasa hispida]